MQVLWLPTTEKTRVQNIRFQWMHSHQNITRLFAWSLGTLLHVWVEEDITTMWGPQTF